MAICGRMLEAQGFRVGIIAQPDWSSKDDFMRLGKPNLFFGVTAGNMDSMINRYTADRRLRHDDAYTPDNVAGKRPDRATLVYTQRCKEAWKDVPVILGVLRLVCAVPRIMITGPIPCAVPCWWIRKPTC